MESAQNGEAGARREAKAIGEQKFIWTPRGAKQEEQNYVEPTNEVPTISGPTYEAPTYQEPLYAEPTYEEPLL